MTCIPTTQTTFIDRMRDSMPFGKMLLIPVYLISREELTEKAFKDEVEMESKDPLTTVASCTLSH